MAKQKKQQVKKKKFGQGFIEYIILLSVLIVALVAAAPSITSMINGGFGKVDTQLQDAIGGSGGNNG